jgi:ribosomal protein L14E/L6E/L27E
MKYILAKSTAGHDKGSWYMIVRQEAGFVWIADGRRRKLGFPKRKNIKHVEITKKTLSLEHYTDKSLRKALWQYNFGEQGVEDYG